MATVEITAATASEDVASVKTLCREFEQWLHHRYGDTLWLLDTYFEPETWSDEVFRLEEIYQPPQGAILLAKLDDKPVGCVLMRRLAEGICEMKRLFVVNAARGKYVGEALCERLVEIAREQGYRSMRLNTGFKQTEAQALYERLGFRRISPYCGNHELVRDVLAFMERKL